MTLNCIFLKGIFVEKKQVYVTVSKGIKCRGSVRDTVRVGVQDGMRDDLQECTREHAKECIIGSPRGRAREQVTYLICWSKSRKAYAFEGIATRSWHSDVYVGRDVASGHFKCIHFILTGYDAKGRLYESSRAVNKGWRFTARTKCHSDVHADNDCHDGAKHPSAGQCLHPTEGGKWRVCRVFWLRLGFGEISDG